VDQLLRHRERLYARPTWSQEIVAHLEQTYGDRLQMVALSCGHNGERKVLYTSSALMRWSLLIRPPMARTHAMNIDDWSTAKSHIGRPPQ